MSPPDASNDNDPVREPTTDELVAMAYADGELDAAARAEFEARLSRDPALSSEVVEYQSLQVLARSMAPPEPMDHEWNRLARDPMQRSLRALGWAAFVGGTVGLTGWGIYGLLQEDGPLARFQLAIAIGFGALLLATAHARIRTYHLDPYRNVQR